MARHRLLLADDSLTVQKVVNLTFADQGKDVATFSDGDAAAGALAAVNPDIVLADVNMPGLDGYQLCELIKRDPAFSHVPVLLLVGTFEPFDREEAERVGANGHMTKPFSSIADLVATVDTLLAHSEPSSVEEAATAPLPDTTDIDSLYEKSVAEPVPGAEGDFAASENGLDDEMIQTSYVDTENDFVIEDEYYSGHADDIAVNDLSQSSLGPDTFAPESEPERFAAGTDEGFASPTGPFDAVASEPPAKDRPSPEFEEAAYTTAQLDDADLLELPTLAGEGETSAEITRLSPELIDLIVDKVVDRLAERGIAVDARTAPHS